MTRIIDSLADVAGDYDALYCDLWGCLHDGVRAMPAAVAALRAFRGHGGRVILLTNAPRDRTLVRDQLDRLGVPRDAWDAVATSGDCARAAIFDGAAGGRIWFMGDARDDGFLDPGPAFPGASRVEVVAPEEAEGIVCCGPRDAGADPAALRDALSPAAARGLPMICANPDVVVDLGETRHWCAGAVAEVYAALGGPVLSYGKPHAPIYDLARDRLAEAAGGPPPARILAVGDGIATDVAGAAAQGLDCLFVTGGLAAAETRTHAGGGPDPAALRRLLDAAGARPAYAIGFLR